MHERDVIERIFKKIKADPSGCWVVDGWNDGKGYQNISVGGKTCKVHRVMFEWFWRRKLRKNVQIDHKCVNRSCCNPLHLQSCLNKKNSVLRNKRKRKHDCQRINRVPEDATGEHPSGIQVLQRTVLAGNEGNPVGDVVSTSEGRMDTECAARQDAAAIPCFSR